jgi:hypothetical protein
MPVGEGSVVCSDELAPQYLAHGWTVVDEAAETPAVVTDLVAPPRAGKGATLGAWRDYALALGIAHADDMTRDDFIAAVDALEGE